MLSCAERELLDAVDYYNAVRDDRVLVVAIMNLKRDPVSWRERANR